MGAVGTRVQDARRLSGLGLRPIDKLKLAGAHLTAPVTRRVGVSMDISADLTYGIRMRFTDDCELLTLKELLAEREYELDGLPQPLTILDLGANIGVSAVLFRRHFPTARIVCVEASPSTHSRLVEHVGHDPLLETINAAVAGRSGEVKFSEGPESWGNQISDDGTVTVRAVTLDELIQRYEIGSNDLIKIDIEGAEFNAIAASELLGRAGSLLGEVHPAFGDPAELFAALEQDGWVMDRPLRRCSFRFVRGCPDGCA